MHFSQNFALTLALGIVQFVFIQLNIHCCCCIHEYEAFLRIMANLENHTCYWKYSDIPHSADVLKAKVSDLRAPPEEERGEGQHGGDVANANVTDVDTSEHVPS